MLQWLVTLFAIVPTTAWMSLAVYYHHRSLVVRLLVALMPLLVVGLGLWHFPLFPWGLTIWAGMFLAVLAWWFLLRPQAERDWAPGLNILPRVEFDGDTIRIREYRHYEYDANGKAHPRYEERTYQLSQLRSLDYFLSHWSGPIMAHTLVSFGFSDGQFLAVSVEARRRRWQRYSPLWGLFRSYELTFVLGDERDIVYLRTNVRRERVYMYRVNLLAERRQRLLLDYLRHAESLASRPKWYNSITSNCTTNLFYDPENPVRWWLKPGIFLNGLSARTLYKLGGLAKSLPFRELQARSEISARAQAAGNALDFSQRIREGLVES